MTGPTGTSGRESAPPIVRLAHLMAFTSFLHEVGVPAERRLRRRGLPAYCQDPEAFVPLSRVWSFFDDADRKDVPMIGWLAGRYVGDRNLHSRLLDRLQSAPTLFQALHRFARLARSEASQIQLGIHERRDDVLLYTHYPGRTEEPGYIQSQFYQLQVFLAVIRHFVGQQWVPDEMGTEHSVVPTVVQAQLPCCRILTRQSAGYVAVPRACLHRPALHNRSESGEADDTVLTGSYDYADVLREVLRPYLSDGYPTARFAAALMETSVRTLARRLSACGLTYRELVDDVRFAAAKELLHHPDMRLSEIAWSVGFSDQSHFTRMCRRVGGLTPGQMRRAALSAQA